MVHIKPLYKYKKSIKIKFGQFIREISHKKINKEKNDLSGHSEASDLFKRI